jgi:4-aminobutyrate aminotransferase
MSALVGRKEIMESLGAPAHTFTGAGNPMACKASLATIEIIKDEDLISKANTHGDYIREEFKKMQEKYNIIGDVRGLGLSIGVELITDTKEKNSVAASKICYRAWEKGVLLTFISQNVLRIQPPLIISKEEIDSALEMIEESIVEFLNGEIPDEVLETSKGW